MYYTALRNLPPLIGPLASITALDHVLFDPWISFELAIISFKL